MGDQRYAYVKYRVEAGDNLTKIARKFNTTVDEIFNMNRIIENKNRIQTGWVLNVPDNR
jgi:LysM repeat protein